MTRYNSKIGPEILFFLIIVLGGVTLLMIYNKTWIGLAIILLVIGFIGYIFTTTYYLIADDVLRIKSGFLVNESVSINKIKEISETNNPIGAPANSLDRLEIKFSKYGTIMISPKNKAEFIKQLIDINPDIVLTIKNKGLLKEIKNNVIDR